MMRTQFWANPTVVQRVEGVVMLIVALWVFAWSGQSWWLFALLLLVPDLSMVGYLRNPALGAVTYNVGHTLVGPGILFGWSVLEGSTLLMSLGSVWLAHLGMDRAFGYGLKYADDFQQTHLGMIGPGKRSRPE